MKKNIYIIVIMLLIILLIAGYILINRNKYILDGDDMIEKDKNNYSNTEILDKLIISVNNKELIVSLEDNSSVKALLEKLKEGNIIINAHDYGNFEKVGDLGFNLPKNDTYITTKPGDLILYQGNQITLYYDTNTYTFTKLGSVNNITKEELLNILGTEDVILELKLERNDKK